MPLLHFALLCAWGGVVLAEAVLEIASARAGQLGFAAVIHYWIDILVEAPLLAGVLATGSVLLARVWPPGPLLGVKVVAGLVAVAANAYCVGVVVVRHRHREDDAALERRSRRIRIVSPAVGVPAALIAAWIGLLRVW